MLNLFNTNINKYALPDLEEYLYKHQELTWINLEYNDQLDLSDKNRIYSLLRRNKTLNMLDKFARENQAELLKGRTRLFSTNQPVNIKAIIVEINKLKKNECTVSDTLNTVIGIIKETSDDHPLLVQLNKLLYSHPLMKLRDNSKNLKTKI